MPNKQQLATAIQQAVNRRRSGTRSRTRDDSVSFLCGPRGCNYHKQQLDTRACCIDDVIDVSQVKLQRAVTCNLCHSIGLHARMVN